ncbi:Keratin, type II cytoskeletal 8 [Pteropus alecto]|uniref:Keratin, type II cytoskeletal 8 n=1 Tax=Pteropus alecto TaxID=9402 RepID=L5JNQ8_PTEAL|nr:Keratin, type II cytoskeletal 8 [Pteropus alecto]
MFESYINNFQQQLDMLAQEKLKLEAEFGNMQELVEDLKNKYEDEINKHMEIENEFVLIKKDVDEAHMNKAELKSGLEGLIKETNFYRQLYEEETHELQAQIFNTSVALSMDTTPWTASSLRSRHNTRRLPAEAGPKLRPCTRSSMRSCRH